ncbi:sigma-70 family RNA polymerase sigma factor [Hamadaea sp.]|uniref:RNA polymerase sigma factor n=1 Tax=Hamadaea sp. TaxID=2024425 RepID=UPI0025C0A534|nr:sigma-70 family RNA polymerase sigma factor [Hamadaea sp.]
MTESPVEAAFRAEWPRVVGALVRRTGDWDLAEDCAQEAFAEAVRRWPVEGVPLRPGAWLTTVAGNRAIDRIRRAARGTQLVAQLAESDHASLIEDSADDISDDGLRLIFTCCHPALALEGRVALTLRAVAGLTTAEIARALLVSESTMAKRLTRTKAKIAAAGIPYRVPPAHLLPERTAGVLAVLYLLFNEGYSLPVRSDLCREAIRLTRLLADLLPGDPEVIGALALMILHHSRRDARISGDGELIALDEQDRRRWDPADRQEGLRLLDSVRDRPAGRYQLQALIAAGHHPTGSDWPRIAQLYAQLEELVPSPVVRLNRAVAVAAAGDIDAGLAIVEELGADPRLESYHLLPATEADLRRRRGDRTGAAMAYRRAIELAPSDIERRFLRRRLDQVSFDDR